MAFVGAGISQGNLNWNARNTKRRAEIARVFEEYKKANPYATAEDYQQFMETVIGPHEMYLRGAIPSDQILARMEQDNLQRKAHDERMRQNELATQNMAVGNQLRERAKQMALSDMSTQDVLEALSKDLETPNSSAEDRLANFEYVKSTLGDFDDLRNRERQDYRYNMENRVLDRITKYRMDPTDSEAMAPLWRDFNPNNYQWMSDYQKELQRKAQHDWNIRLEEEQRQRDRLKIDFMNAMRNDQLLIDQLAPGSGEEEVARQTIAKYAKLYGVNEEDLVDSTVKDLRLRRTQLIEAKGKRDFRENYDLLSAQAKAALKDQDARLGGAGATRFGKESQEMKDLYYISQAYVVPASLDQRLIKFVAEHAGDDINIAEEFRKTLAPGEQQGFIPRSQADAYVMEQAKKMSQRHEDADSFMQGGRDSLIKANAMYQAKVDSLRTRMGGINLDITPVRTIDGYIKETEAALNALGGFAKNATDANNEAARTQRDWLTGSKEFTQADADKLNTQVGHIVSEQAAHLQALHKQLTGLKAQRERVIQEKTVAQEAKQVLEEKDALNWRGRGGSL